MRPTLKQVLLYLGLLTLGLHFVLVIIHANPIATTKGKLSYYADYYTYPYFEQTWALFAPPPCSNYSLFAVYNQNGQQRKDIFAELLTKHQSNRLSGYEPLEVALVNSIHYFEQRTELQQKINGPIVNDVNFKLVEHFALNYLRNTVNDSINTVRLMLVVKNEKKNLQRVYYD